MKRNIVIAIIVVCLCGFAVYKTSTGTAAALKVGHTPPDFTLTAMDGRDYSVEGAKNKALWINFWASWCGPCQTEAPDIVRMYEKYGQDLEIYAVNATNYDSTSDAKQFAADYNFTFPVLLDKKGIAGDLYHVDNYPTSYLIGSDGLLKEIIVGILPPQELEQKIADLIENRQPAAE